MKEFIEKLIGRLEEEKNKRLLFEDNATEEEAGWYFSGSRNGLADAISIVNKLAEEYINCSTDTSSGWIPTSERLPEKNAIVLTCDKDGWISVKVNMPYAGAKNDFECGYYTAWMPLPPAYVPKEGRE